MSEINSQFESAEEENSKIALRRLKLFVLRPIFVGLFTFSIFFSVILFTKIITYLMNENATFILNVYDVLFAFIGLLIGFLVEFLLQIRKKLFT